MILTTTLARLRAHAEDSEDYDEEKFAPLLENVERAAWRTKNKSRKDDGHLMVAPLAHGGVDFALWALGAAEQEDEANRIGALICMDVALRALGQVADASVAQLKEELGQWRAGFRGAEDCAAARRWVSLRWDVAHSAMDLDTLWGDQMYHGHHLAIHVFTAGTIDERESDAEFMAGWRRAPCRLIPSAVELLKLTDPVYAFAREIADRAEAAQKRWQRGTRLEFDFLDDLRAELGDEEDRAAERAETVVRGWTEAAFAEHVRARG